MTLHLTRAVDHLKKQLLNHAALVEEQVTLAVVAVQRLDSDLARQVKERDNLVGKMEIEIEEEGLKVLALYQPVALDLRFVISVLKINNDLERIGDLAVHIADRAMTLSSVKQGTSPLQIQIIAEKAIEMLKSAINSFVERNPQTAWRVCQSDTEVDELHSANYPLLNEALQKDASQANALLSYLSVSRYLERIADLATNIAEDVIYLVEGNVVRRSELVGTRANA